MPPKAKTYAQAVESARAAVAAARLADPDEHFPYRHAAALKVIEDNLPMGPGVPDGRDGLTDRSRTVDDYLTVDIADASRDYVDAQAAVLSDPSEANRAAYLAAQDRLVAARLDHRRNRGAGFTIGAAARRAG